MFTDLSNRQLAPVIADSLVDYVNESINLQVDRPNIVRLIHSLMKGFKGNENQFFKDNILEGIVLKYLNGLISKMAEDIDNLSKENIDAVTSKSLSTLRTLYKLNKFQIEINNSLI